MMLRPKTMSCTITAMTDTPAPSYSEQPTLAKSVADRCNAAFAKIAEGELMQNPRPFEAVKSGGSVVIALVCAPRDCEIFAAILERIERDTADGRGPQPGEGQQQLDV